MHGLVNRAIQGFISDSYGVEIWDGAVLQAGLPFSTFEPMMIYEDAITPRILDAASAVLECPRTDIMEDIGTYLVSHSNMEAIRRLLRFSGLTLLDFLHSLDELPDRVRMAVPELILPKLELIECSQTEYLLECEAPVAGFGHVMLGVLRTMADDYGALALLEHHGDGPDIETVSITLVETDFAEGRDFELGARV